MTRPLYLHTVAVTPEPCADDALRALLAQHQIDPRRLSRLTRLALAALLPALNQAAPAQHLFLAAPSGSPQKFRRSLSSFTRDNLPNLLDFNASLPNAALFACCRAAAVAGSSLFCAVSARTLAQPLTLAAHTVWQQGGRAWVGWAYEHSDGAGRDGALWWQIGTEADKHNLAELVLQAGSGTAGVDPEPAYWPYARELLLQSDTLVPDAGNRGWQRRSL